jgi:hypothetical protein
MPYLVPALKGRNAIAQGAALSTQATTPGVLKERDTNRRAMRLNQLFILGTTITQTNIK